MGCPNNYGIFVNLAKIKDSKPTKLNSVLPRVSIGDRVHVKHKRQYGTLRFVGIASFDDGCWYGVELDEPMGTNNGFGDDNMQYFECDDYYGIFCQSKNIEPDNKAKNKMKPKHNAQKASSDLGQIG